MSDPDEKMLDRKGIGDFVSLLVRQLKYRRDDFKTIGPMGGFTSLIDLGNIAIAFNTDGVGTKVLLAADANKWEGIGIDCVAMNVNDTITVGAEPIAMLDYLSLRNTDPLVAKELGVGLNVGAQMANISIIGGESALVPDIVNPIDVAGSVIGIVQKNSIITGERISDGDIIYSLQSSGLHSNGFTTVRKILKSNGIGMDEKFPGENKKTSEVVLEPTRIYVRDILDIVNIVDIKGMANITGGGFKNIVRLKDMKYVFEDPVEPQNVFKQLKELGNLTWNQMYETFNMGTGFMVIINEESKSDFITTLRTRMQIREIGHVENGSGIEIPKYGVKIEGYY
ncbi:MAG: phosphoribosylformylglycinamidine cyclo-ligase [Candidatus Thermoplasmatota archaeon]|jgi:phosphoribosylformylglycinamidine cyclo-ligase|nr:phosphoribosylformylglycinamidine cyclo-ligase [Candidatus Thermoplasmatota archaeon]MCL5790993.1 phosphoribosylformylglycinamidine cyclo-ligase [Candidatus Thermoplasmatota archaeon]